MSVSLKSIVSIIVFDQSKVAHIVSLGIPIGHVWTDENLSVSPSTLFSATERVYLAEGKPKATLDDYAQDVYHYLTHLKAQYLKSLGTLVDEHPNIKSKIGLVNYAWAKSFYQNDSVKESFSHDEQMCNVLDRSSLWCVHLNENFKASYFDAADQTLQLSGAVVLRNEVAPPEAFMRLCGSFISWSTLMPDAKQALKTYVLDPTLAHAEAHALQCLVGDKKSVPKEHSKEHSIPTQRVQNTRSI